MSSEDSEENLETLQEYIDWCFDVIVMKKNQNACSLYRHPGFNRQAVVQLRREVVPGRDPAP